MISQNGKKLLVLNNFKLKFKCESKKKLVMKHGNSQIKHARPNWY
jgi:hypothetical protein